MTFRCKSIFDFIFHFSFIKSYRLSVCKTYTVQANQQQRYQIIDEIVTHQHNLSMG